MKEIHQHKSSGLPWRPSLYPPWRCFSQGKVHLPITVSKEAVLHELKRFGLEATDEQLLGRNGFGQRFSRLGFDGVAAGKIIKYLMYTHSLLCIRQILSNSSYSVCRIGDPKAFHRQTQQFLCNFGLFLGAQNLEYSKIRQFENQQVWQK